MQSWKSKKKLKMGHSRLFLQDPEYKLYFNYEILCLFYKLVLCLTACDSDNHHKLVNVLGLLCSKLLFAIFASKGWMVVISVTFHLRFGWVNQPTALYLAFVIGDKCMHCLYMLLKISRSCRNVSWRSHVSQPGHFFKIFIGPCFGSIQVVIWVISQLADVFWCRCIFPLFSFCLQSFF
jgi:hypothetical protein